MSKGTKAILYGVGCFVLSLAVLVGVRSLISDDSVADGLKHIWNWVIAVLSGVSGGWSVWKKDNEKKDQ